MNKRHDDGKIAGEKKWEIFFHFVLVVRRAYNRTGRITNLIRRFAYVSRISYMNFSLAIFSPFRNIPA